jgi:hypothetical protein
LSAVPYIVFWIFIISSGIICDRLVQQYKMSKTFVRKIFNSLSMLVPMGAVIGLCFVNCETKMIGVALLTLGLAFTGCGYGGGFLVNLKDFYISLSKVFFFIKLI